MRDFRGAHSVSKVLHGRIAKLDLPERTEPLTWAERVPAITDPQTCANARETATALDARVIELGTVAAGTPPAWASRYLGVPPKEAGALRDDWISRVGQVAQYREAAGIDDPQQAVGPAPAGNPELRQMYLQSVSALEMQTEEAEVRAVPQRDLEARVRGYAREATHAPANVAPELESAARAEADTRAQIETARVRNDADLEWSAEALVSDLMARKDALSEVQGVRDEWAEATAPRQAQARLAAAELARRGVEPEIEPEAGTAPVIEAPDGDADRQPRAQAESTAEWFRAFSSDLAGVERSVERQRLQAEADGTPWPPVRAEAQPETEADQVERPQARTGPEIMPENMPEAATAETGPISTTPVYAPKSPEPVAPEPGPAGDDAQRQLEQITEATQRLHEARTPEIEPEADLAARELAQAEAEASEAGAWQDGAAATQPAETVEASEGAEIEV